jgi:hypothetical protein
MTAGSCNVALGRLAKTALLRTLRWARERRVRVFHVVHESRAFELLVPLVRRLDWARGYQPARRRGGEQQHRSQ